MKQRERTDQRAVGFDEFPDEALRAVETDREIESVVDHKAVVAAYAPDVDERERGHGGALVQLHRMAHDAVAEIVAPRQLGWRTVGQILESGEKAADDLERAAAARLPAASRDAAP